jgi:phage-related tail fiber protein
VPDLRGEFVRGWDNNKGTDPGRALGTSQLDEIKSHTHPLVQVLTYPSRPGFAPVAEQAQSGSPDDYSAYSPTTSATGGAETRPRNIALMYIIKT